jgi:hypothetical protein
MLTFVLACSNVDALEVAPHQPAVFCLSQPDSLRNVRVSNPAFGTLHAPAIEQATDGSLSIDPTLSNEADFCISYMVNNFTGCPHAKDLLAYTLYGHSGTITSCHLTVTIRQMPESLDLEATDMFVYSDKDILTPMKVTSQNVAPTSPAQFQVSLAVQAGLLGVVMQGHTELQDSIAPRGSQNGTPTLHMKGTLLEINRRLALLYYHQPVSGLVPLGSDEMIVHIHSVEANNLLLQRKLQIRAVNHAQVSSVRFSQSGNEIRILSRTDFSNPLGSILCASVFSTSSVLAMDAKACAIDGKTLTISSGARATVRPGDKITMKLGALWINETETAIELPVSNDLAPASCSAQITQATVSLCAGVSSYLLVSDPSNRAPRFIWGSNRGSCALQSYLAGIDTRELLAPKELLHSEALDLDLQAVCVNFMGQYGELNEATIDVSEDGAPQPQILMPNLIKVISGFDVGIIGSVTQPDLKVDGCLAMEYSQLESRCCPCCIDHTPRFTCIGPKEWTSGPQCRCHVVLIPCM